MVTSEMAKEFAKTHGGEWFVLRRGAVDGVSSVSLAKYFGIPYGISGSAGVDANRTRNGIRAERKVGKRGHNDCYLWRLTFLQDKKPDAPIVEQLPLVTIASAPRYIAESDVAVMIMAAVANAVAVERQRVWTILASV